MSRTANLSRPTSESTVEPVKSAARIDFIAENLRKLYGAVEAEPLPPRLEALLASLAEAEEDKGDNGGAA